MAKLEIPVKVDIAGIEKLIDELKDLQTYKMYEGDNQTLVDRDEVARVFADNVKAEVAQPEQRWISCERELPDDYTDVLVWFEYFRYGDYNCLYQTYGIGNYSMKYDSWMINHETGWKKLRVIAWMPLPEPWRGET